MIEIVAQLVWCTILVSFIANEFKWVLWAVNPNLLPGSIKLEIEEMRRDAV